MIRPWLDYKSSDGRTYFHNHLDGRTVWEKPDDFESEFLLHDPIISACPRPSSLQVPYQCAQESDDCSPCLSLLDDHSAALVPNPDFAGSSSAADTRYIFAVVPVVVFVSFVLIAAAVFSCCL